MKKTCFFAAVIIASIVLSSTSFGYSGGDGSAENPYKIADAEDLLELSGDTDNCDKNFILISDIDLEGQVFTTAIIAPDANNLNYDFDGIEFTGTLDGNSHQIENLTIHGQNNHYIGLLGQVGPDGQIDNLSILNANIQGDYYVGGLAGANFGIINSCYTTGAVSGNGGVGGLAGVNSSGTIDSCHSTASVDGMSTVGGLVGFNQRRILGDENTILFCYATGEVIGDCNIGGLVGSSYDGTILGCYATGVVNGESAVGGLVGEISPSMPLGSDENSTLISCYATGSVSGSFTVGGLVGANIENEIIDCYSTGSVTGTSDVGGLVGWSAILEEQCETVCNPSCVTICDYEPVPDSSMIQYSFWDTETSGQTNSSGGTGKTTAEMKTLSTFTSAGWDFSDTDGDSADWWMPGNNYPRLAWDHYSGGSGTAENPYQIADVNDLLDLAATTADYDKCFILTADIDLDPNLPGGQVFTTALIAPDIDDAAASFQGTAFTGEFDGNDHIISNLVINSQVSDFVGLFGSIQAAGKIRNLILENCTLTGALESYYIGSLAGFNNGSIENCIWMGSVGGYYVGGLIGYNYGNITNCQCEGTVSGIADCPWAGGLTGYNSGTIRNCSLYVSISGSSNTQRIGGLAGYNSGTIESCVSSGSVSGTFSIGGLVGVNVSSIRNCCSSSSVNGYYSVGGLTGFNNGAAAIIDFCYSTGAVSGTLNVGGLVGRNSSNSVNNCFWDTETSGQTTSSGGTGRTTIEMQDPNTFLNADWDFTNETENGTNDFWRMCVYHADYPQLSWYRGSKGDFACPDGIGVEDLIVLAQNWLASESLNPETFNYACDTNNDGFINQKDFIRLSKYWDGIDYIQSNIVKECQESSEIKKADLSDSLRFTATVQGQTILFEDLVFTNCCMNQIQLHVSIMSGQIVLEEHVSISTSCLCLCDFPVEAVLGPFPPGEYVFTVVQFENGREIDVIGEVPVVIE